MKYETVITFDGRPTLLEISRALNEVEKLFSQYTEVEITTNGFDNPTLEEVWFKLVSDT